MRPIVWIGSALEDLKTFPAGVRSDIGHALFVAQSGEKHGSAKPLKGYKGAGVLEIVEDHDGATYRAVYTVRLKGRLYVLHAFQKKSKSGIATPRQHLDLAERRLKRAEAVHAAWLAGGGENGT